MTDSDTNADTEVNFIDPVDGDEFDPNEPIEAPASYDLSAIAVPNVAPAVSARGGGQGASIMMINPQDGSQVARSAYMQALAKAGWTRQQILVHVRDVTNDPSLRYQTVYQATKDFYEVKPRTSVVLGQPTE